MKNNIYSGKPSENEGKTLVSFPNISTLAIVVIARNEELHIEKSLAALVTAVKRFPSTRILLVDSHSTDRTIAIADKFPIEIYRYQGPPFTAAAGRRVGFGYARAKYVLFVDGDCCIDPDWIEHGLEALEATPNAGIAYGLRREIFEGANTAAAQAAPAAGLSGLGGNGLYRYQAMEKAGGFNPYLPSGEEAELLARIQAAGYHEVAIPHVMFTHYTLPKTSVHGYFDRVRRGLASGIGQTLRVALSHGLFLHHARRLNRYVIAVCYLFMGLMALLLSVVMNEPLIFSIWCVAGFAAFGLLYLRRRSFRSAMFIFADWFTVALYIPRDFLRKPRDPKKFQPDVERLK